jgi:hypothetical protein
MRNIYHKIFILAVFSFFVQKNYSQIVISGPTCVVPKTIYQYVITGNWDSTSSVQVCTISGLITDTLGEGKSCTPYKSSKRRILVIWNDSTSGAGSISVTSPIGNKTLNVTITQRLIPGTIDSASKVQIIKYNSIPSIITVGSNLGGACFPSYSYQWQYTFDMSRWIDLPLATGSNLKIDSALTQSKFYRRKVTELASGEIGYSDPAYVFVIPPHADTVSHSYKGINRNRIDSYTHRFKNLSNLALGYKIVTVYKRQWTKRENHFNEILLML